MKRMLACALALGLPLASFSQQNANSLLGRLPEPPAGACGLSSEARQAYLGQLEAVDKDIQAALEKRKEAQEAHVQQNEEKWNKQMMKQMGLTDAQIARAEKGDDLSDEETSELADQVMQQRSNISLDEVKKLGTMDEKGQQAWAKAYASEVAANVQAQTPDERTAAQKEQSRVKNLVTITREQQDFFKKNNAEGMALIQRMTEWDQEAQKAYAQQITPIDQRLAKCQEAQSRAEGKQSDALAKQIEQIEKERNTALKNYCTQFTPNYCDMLRRYLAWAKGAVGGFDRYEELENEKFRLQSNAPDAVLLVSVGTAGIQEAADCVNLMRSAFKYRLFSDDTEGTKPE